MTSDEKSFRIVKVAKKEGIKSAVEYAGFVGVDAALARDLLRTVSGVPADD